MNKHQKALVQATATQFLMPDEKVELVAFVGRGDAQVKQNAARLGLALAMVAVVSALGGAMFAFVKPAQRPGYIVLTDRKIILFAASPKVAGIPQYLGSAPRTDATATIVKEGIKLWVQLDIAAATKQSVATKRLTSTRLSFPSLPPSARAAGRHFVASLQSGIAVEADRAAV